LAPTQGSEPVFCTVMVKLEGALGAMTAGTVSPDSAHQRSGVSAPETVMV
jgi:hypothetical protein